MQEVTELRTRVEDRFVVEYEYRLEYYMVCDTHNGKAYQYFDTEDEAQEEADRLNTDYEADVKQTPRHLHAWSAATSSMQPLNIPYDPLTDSDADMVERAYHTVIDRPDRPKLAIATDQSVGYIAESLHGEEFIDAKRLARLLENRATGLVIMSRTIHKGEAQ